MAESKNDRRQALELAISSIERQFGKGSVMRLGAGGPLEEIAVIPTGALSLDAALGIGVLPRGRVVEIYGPESSGKTTLALHVVAEAQGRLAGCTHVALLMTGIRGASNRWDGFPGRRSRKARTSRLCT